MLLLRALSVILAGLTALAVGVVVPAALMLLALAAGVVLLLDKIAPSRHTKWTPPQGTA